MTADLAAWLVGDDGPIAEHERVARAAAPTPEAAQWRVRNPRFGSIETGDGQIVTYDEGKPTAEQCEHITTWDPARVLAECAAKRAIIEYYERAIRTAADFEINFGEPDEEAESYRRGLLRAVHLLAQPYAGWPGWREEWVT